MNPGRLVVAVIACAVGVAGCGSPRRATAPSTSTSAAAPVGPATPPVSTATLSIAPTSSPVGTSFALHLSGAKPAEQVTFKIDFPNGKSFTGQPHTAGADGGIVANYVSTSGNPTGIYRVTATGNRGTAANAQFTVTAATSGGATPTTQARPSGASTTTTRATAPTTTTLRTTTTVHH